MRKDIVMENRLISEIPRKPNGVVRCKKMQVLKTSQWLR